MFSDFEDGVQPPTLRLRCKDGQTLETHDQLLGLASPYLATLLTVARSQSAAKTKTVTDLNTAHAADHPSPRDQTSTALSELSFSDDLASDWQTLLDTLQPGRRAGVAISDFDQCLRLLRMAHKYQIRVVQQELVTYLDQAVKDTDTTTERLLQALHVSYQLNLGKLGRRCVDMLRRHANQVLTDPTSASFTKFLTAFKTSASDPCLASYLATKVFPIFTQTIYDQLTAAKALQRQKDILQESTKAALAEQERELMATRSRLVDCDKEILANQDKINECRDQIRVLEHRLAQAQAQLKTCNAPCQSPTSSGSGRQPGAPDHELHLCQRELERRTAELSECQGKLKDYKARQQWAARQWAAELKHCDCLLKEIELGEAATKRELERRAAELSECQGKLKDYKARQQWAARQWAAELKESEAKNRQFAAELKQCQGMLRDDKAKQQWAARQWAAELKQCDCLLKEIELSESATKRLLKESQAKKTQLAGELRHSNSELTRMLRKFNTLVPALVAMVVVLVAIIAMPALKA